MPVRVALFNHKGGVGKTTLSVNLAYAIAATGKTVLLVDSDPQCNSTAYLIDNEVVNDLLDHSDEGDGRTLWSAVKPLVEGTGDVRAVEPFSKPGGVFVLPGDIRLSEFESELGEYFRECFQRKPRGFRGVTALRRVVSAASAACKADFVFYDTGPNIGPLNRAILLDCDYFAVPAACDLFSLRAVKTLGRTLVNWLTDWETIAQLAPSGVELLPGAPKLLGYIPQQFRVYAKGPASSYQKVITQLDTGVQEDLIKVLKRLDPELTTSAVAPLRLGLIQQFGSLATGAQEKGVPIWESDSGTEAQRVEAKRVFAELAQVVVSRALPRS